MSNEAFESFRKKFDKLATTDGCVPWDALEPSVRIQVSMAIGTTAGRPPRYASKQTIEAEARMWQRRVGRLLSLIEERAPDIVGEAHDMVNTNWYTKSLDREGTAHKDAVASLEEPD